MKGTVLRLPVIRGVGAALILVAVCVAVYGNTFRNGFVWDDQAIILENPATQDISRIGTVLLAPDEVNPYYRPLNRASYLLDYQLFGLDPRGFHSVNVALHAAAVLLLFALGTRVFSEAGPALVAALLLAVHPIHSESVNFVTARNNIWALVFSLAAVVLFVDANRLRSRVRAGLSGLAFFLGLLSKEQGLMVLPLMALWAIIPELSGSLLPSVRPSDLLSGRGRWRAVATLAPHLAVLGAYILLRSLALGGPVASADITPGLPGRIAQNYHTLPRYVGLIVFPRDLTIFQVPPPQTVAFFSPALGVWVLFVAVLVTVVRWRSLPSSVGLLWFGLNLLPISNIVPIPSAPIAERYFYLPAVGLWFVAAEGLRRWQSRITQKRAIRFVVVVVLAALAARSVARNFDWHDDVSLARSAAETTPGSVSALFNLGDALKESGDLQGARVAWEEAARLDPGDPKVLTQLGTLEALAGDIQQAEALLRRALRYDPRTGVAHFNIGRICERTGRSAQALEHYENFLRFAGPMEANLVPVAEERVRAIRAAHPGNSADP